MDLSDVQKTMVPGAEEVLKTGIGYHAGREAFLLTMINVALQQSGDSPTIAARKLGIEPSMVTQAVRGTVLTQYRGGKQNRKRKAGDEQK